MPLLDLLDSNCLLLVRIWEDLQRIEHGKPHVNPQGFENHLGRWLQKDLDMIWKQSTSRLYG